MDFQIKKEELAARIAPSKKSGQEKSRPRRDRLGKVGRFILNPRLISILEERLSGEGQA